MDSQFIFIIIYSNYSITCFIILFSMDYSSGNLIIKFIYIGAIYALIKANSFSREFLGGVSTTISQNVNNFFKK